jgi:hypothetical protein
VKIVSLLQARSDLSYFDHDNEGYLKEEVKIFTLNIGIAELYTKINAFSEFRWS